MQPVCRVPLHFYNNIFIYLASEWGSAVGLPYAGGGMKEGGPSIAEAAAPWSTWDILFGLIG